MKPQHIVAASAHAFFRDGKPTLPSNKDIIIAQREWLESAPQFRQLIPYVLIRHKGKFLAYQRGKGGNEARLHNLISIGFGGHVDIEDVVHTGSVIDVEATLANSMAREIAEELCFGEQPAPTIRATEHLLLLDTTSVDSVHAGVLMIADVELDTVESPEDGQIHLLGFLSIDEILANTNLETWTRYAAEMLKAAA